VRRIIFHPRPGIPAALALAVGLAVTVGSPAPANALDRARLSAPKIVRTVSGVFQVAKGAAAVREEPSVAVFFRTPRQGWIISGCGYRQPLQPGRAPSLNPCVLLSTQDGGASWHAELTTAAQLGGLAFPTAKDGFAWTVGGLCPSGNCPTVLYATTNGGRTWTPRYRGPLSLESLAFPSSRTGWATAEGALLRSLDRGRSWRQALATRACRFQSVTFHGAVGLAIGQGGAGVCAYRTTDAGAHWRAWLWSLTSPAATQAFTAFVHAYGLDKFLGSPARVAGQCGPGPAQPTGPQGAWLTVLCNPIDPDMLAVFHTDDGGRSWHLAWSTPGCAMSCQVKGKSSSPLFFLGDAAWRAVPYGVSETADGGRTWARAGRLCPEPQCLPALDFLSRDVGFAATGAGAFATADGGRSWRRIWPSAGPGKLMAVSLVSPGLGFGVPALAPSTLLATEDRGQTWREVTALPRRTAVLAVAFLIPAPWLRARQPGRRRGVPRDQGRGFRALSPPKRPLGNALTECPCRSTAVGMVVDALGHARRTRDGGRHWPLLTPPSLVRLGVVAWAGAHALLTSVLGKS
jgi:photosystem II stability/assembly factor-like uncharacterized protein